MNNVSVALQRRGSGEKYGTVFILAFLSMFIVLVPLMILDKGYFIYYGDFVSQQLPFYFHANGVVHDGGMLGWDWGTDLGSSFLGSYAFYLTGSPFFWLSTLLPQNLVLYAIPWLLCLKHAVAALTAYGYIRRFVRNKQTAVIGGLLYAFSGFQVFNIFFNHFQDVTAFFPLLLIAMEELVNNNRHGWFAACVALMAIINYFFFTGQVVFCILYFLVRLNCRDFHIDLKKFFALAIEAVIGVCIACVVLMPAAMAILANERVSQSLYGQNMILYSDKTRILRIIQSFFMIPDAPARPNLLDTDSGKWASIGGYLPLFSMAGVITFMKQKKKHWAAILTWVCILCAFVPVLNSAFYMFNGSYYARWYYMPILIMAMMTAYALDNVDMKWRTGVVSCAAMLGAFLIIAFLPTKGEDGKAEFFHFAKIYPYFFVVMAMCLLCWLGLYCIYCRRKEGKPWIQRAVCLTTAACMVCTGTVVYFGKVIGIKGETYREQAIYGAEKVSISYENDADSYFRVDISENLDNYPMFWGLSCMRCFQSVVNPSIMDFYESIGISRDVSSRADISSYTLRGLFSVKYYFDQIKEDEDGKEIWNTLELPGFVFEREENGFRIYRNDYYIPMGFAYDYYVAEDVLENKSDAVKEHVLIKALVLDEAQTEKYADIIENVPQDALAVSETQYLEECTLRREQSCTDFTYDSKGFAANISLDASKLVFFSVPYESGWTATVNGSPVDVERVSNGFMAVRCEAGENEIVFSYELPGLRYGLYLTLFGLVLLVLYMAFSKPLFSAKHGTQQHCYDYTSASGVRAAQAYAYHLAKHDTQKDIIVKEYED